MTIPRPYASKDIYKIHDLEVGSFRKFPLIGLSNAKQTAKYFNNKHAPKHFTVRKLPKYVALYREK